jgi:hypothetical protein
LVQRRTTRLLPSQRITRARRSLHIAFSTRSNWLIYKRLHRLFCLCHLLRTGGNVDCCGRSSGILFPSSRSRVTPGDFPFHFREPECVEVKTVAVAAKRVAQGDERATFLVGAGRPHTETATPERRHVWCLFNVKLSLCTVRMHRTFVLTAKARCLHSKLEREPRFTKGQARTCRNRKGLARENSLLLTTLRLVVIFFVDRGS